MQPAEGNDSTDILPQSCQYMTWQAVQHLQVEERAQNSPGQCDVSACFHMWARAAQSAIQLQRHGEAQVIEPCCKPAPVKMLSCYRSQAQTSQPASYQKLL